MFIITCLKDVTILQEENTIVMAEEELKFAMIGRVIAVYFINGLEKMDIKKVFN